MAAVSLCKEVCWHSWDDGIAVFVPATSETHLLSPELLPLFVGDVEAFRELAAAMFGGHSEPPHCDDMRRLAEVGARLCALKILVTES